MKKEDFEKMTRSEVEGLISEIVAGLSERPVVYNGVSERNIQDPGVRSYLNKQVFISSDKLPQDPNKEKLMVVGYGVEINEGLNFVIEAIRPSESSPVSILVAVPQELQYKKELWLIAIEINPHIYHELPESLKYDREVTTVILRCLLNYLFIKTREYSGSFPEAVGRLVKILP